MRVGHRGPGGPFGGGEMGMHQGPKEEAIIHYLLSDAELSKEVGLTDEQMAAIRKGMYDLKEKQIELQAQLERAATEQVKLMTEKEIDEDAVMAAVEKTGEIRTAVAKLRVKGMLLIRKHISTEQIAEIRNALREKMQERMRQHRNTFRKGQEQGDWRQWRDTRRRRPEDGDTPKPPGPDRRPGGEPGF